MDLPRIKLIFLYTLSVTATPHPAPTPFHPHYVLYVWYALSVKSARNNTFHCIPIHVAIINQIKLKDGDRAGKVSSGMTY